MDQRTAIDEPNLVDSDVNAAEGMLVEDDLAPELTSTEQANIHQEEEMIIQKKQYKTSGQSPSGIDWFCGDATSFLPARFKER